MRGFDNLGHHRMKRIKLLFRPGRQSDRRQAPPADRRPDAGPGHQCSSRAL